MDTVYVFFPQENIIVIIIKATDKILELVGA